MQATSETPSHDHWQDGEPTTLDFMVRWADGELAAAARDYASRPDDALSLREVAVVTRIVARCFGDRPLRAVTFGELAALPALLEQAGLSRDAARGACRALGAALGSALRHAPDPLPRRPAPHLALLPAASR